MEARQGTSQNVSFDTSFQTGERVLSVKVNFIEKGGNAMNREEIIFGDDVHNWSEEDTKMAWMRETRIMTFMQMELEACLDEVDWLIRCHNCTVYNYPEEEYPPRPIPIPPDYIDNLQSRFVKVKKGILPPTLKMILKTYCYFPVHQAPVTSPAVQSNDMIARHREGEYNPLERPQASEEKEKGVTDGTSSTDQGGDFVFQIKVGMDHEASQVAAHHFKLAMFRQQQGTTAKSTDGGETTHSSRLWGEPDSDSSTSCRPRGGCDQSATARGASTEQNKPFDPGGRRVNC